jgi:hypothetical protein
MHQHRFRLVIGMMANNNSLSTHLPRQSSKEIVPRLASGFFQRQSCGARQANDVGFFDVAGDIEGNGRVRYKLRLSHSLFPPTMIQVGDNQGFGGKNRVQEMKQRQ